jgi:hypothetical protein
MDMRVRAVIASGVAIALLALAWRYVGPTSVRAAPALTPSQCQCVQTPVGNPAITITNCSCGNLQCVAVNNQSIACIK